MAKVDFCFYGELNFFLPPKRKNISFTHIFEEHPSIKDMIESFGVPHPEVSFIFVNNNTVDFSYLVQDGDRISVYPISQAETIRQTHPQPLISVAPPPLPIPKFVIDIHLGKLATSLRMLGFDTLYRNDYGDEELAYISSTEERTLLTRNRGLLMRSIVTYGYYVRSTNPQQQILEVMKRFELFKTAKPFDRCIRCNGLLESVAKESILDQIPPQVQQIDKFHRCIECSQIYWKGSHVEKMQQVVESLLNSQP
ncbi:protein of unknown function DUF82 [Crinalium epipsammum PCC 9333]|uniref:Twitching motility protein PilT n=1 Tax=Crinalium epipsammum PCC 9333 TaxID=1173022 RepID=K9W560_9CYAN|nr:Mut7-C RNAse domain-containing protein [Crinalium epipsammum]AFZ15336.1 protein of unknown function DUF82 [Crinalium epipsammum PCC 9333]